jgi:DNA-binding response OmpR family regulator
MLIPPAAEAKVLESLELDAFDHVPKPITTSVLMQRVRRALA